jgi:flagellar assembly factor FliW
MPEDPIEAQGEVREIELPRFGTCAYRDDEILHFEAGLPGFEFLRRFLVLSLAGQEHFVWLQSLDDPSVALPMTNPYDIFPDYEPKFPMSALESLGISRADDFVVMCVCIVTKDAAEMSCNLLAPVVINLRGRVGRQVTLEGSSYAVKEPIPRKSAPAPSPREAPV